MRMNPARIALGLLLVAASSCDFMLTRPPLYSTVPVSVTLANGDPVAGVNLELYTGARPMDYGTTGADGRFTFEHVPLGNYGVFAIGLPPGYVPADKPYVDGLDVEPGVSPPVHIVVVQTAAAAP
jgi:hypothetical protein